MNNLNTNLFHFLTVAGPGDPGDAAVISSGLDTAGNVVIAYANGTIKLARKLTQKELDILAMKDESTSDEELKHMLIMYRWNETYMPLEYIAQRNAPMGADVWDELYKSTMAGWCDPKSVVDAMLANPLCPQEIRDLLQLGVERLESLRERRKLEFEFLPTPGPPKQHRRSWWPQWLAWD